MVLAFQAPRMSTLFRAAQWLPNVFTWLLVVLVLTLFAWTYFSNPQPGPYGMCNSKGRPVSCHSLRLAK